MTSTWGCHGGRWTAAIGLAAACLLAGVTWAVPPAGAFQTAYPPQPPTGGGPFLPLRAEPNYGEGIGAGRGHEGQDLFAPTGTPEVAILDSVVVESGSGYEGGRGNFVSIYSTATKRTYNYFHMLAAPRVRTGERVRAGQTIGRLGCSGSCWGDHLHFEIRRGRDPYGPVLDPKPLLKGLAIAPPESAIAPPPTATPPARHHG